MLFRQLFLDADNGNDAEAKKSSKASIASRNEDKICNCATAKTPISPRIGIATLNASFFLAFLAL
jgi:hypothetical protein